MISALPPLTFGQVKANRATIDALATPAADIFAITANAGAFLALAGVTPEQLDAETPADINAAAAALFSVTFTRPEVAAQVVPNP